MDVTSTFHLSCVRLSSASSDDRVIISVPKSNRAVFTSCDKFVRNSRHEPAANNGLSVRFAK
jgi:hypothetical protein